MADNELLARTAELYEMLEGVEWQKGAAFRGRLLFAETCVPVLSRLEDAESIQIRFNDRSQTVRTLLESNPAGHQIEVIVEPPHTFARDLDDLLAIGEFAHSPPEFFYLAADRYLHPQGVMPAKVAQYFEVVKFIHLLRDIADHVDRRPTHVWIVLLAPDGKIEFPIVYKPSDIEHVTNVAALAETVTESPQETVMKGLLRNVVTQLLANVSTGDRLGFLLNHFPEAQKRFFDNLELYLRNFSFETEKEKLEAQKREYMLKLNNALGDIHTKLIAIPAAVVLVGGQMKPTDSTATLISNFVLLLGAAIFTLLMFIMTKNQRHSLAALRWEFQHRRDRLKLEVPTLYLDIQSAFAELDSRYNHQMRLIKTVNYLVVLGLICSTAVFVMYVLQAPAGAAKEPLFHLLTSLPTSDGTRSISI